MSGESQVLTGLRQHRIKNTSSDFKRTQRPWLVQTEALFNKDGCLYLISNTEALSVETDMVHCF